MRDRRGDTLQSGRGDISRLLAEVVAGKGEQCDLDTVAIRLGTVADGARCSLAAQQQTVVGSLLGFPDRMQARVLPGSPPVESDLVAPVDRFTEHRAGLSR